MNHLQGPPAELRFTLSIKRAATGLVETYDMVGHTLPVAAAAPTPAPPANTQPQPDPKETNHVNHP